MLMTEATNWADSFGVRTYQIYSIFVLKDPIIGIQRSARVYLSVNRKVTLNVIFVLTFMNGRILSEKGD